MRRMKKVLALLLMFCMTLNMTMSAWAAEQVPAETAETADDFYKIVHLDAGRKYFSPENIKKVIDTSTAAGFNQLELYLSDNQGFRFALDDMNVTTSTGNTYDLTQALGDGYSDGSKYPDGSGKFLTQAEVTDIIQYANEKGMEIVPCINVPGHMGAILEVFPQFCYSGSKSSINLENAEAVAFALALTEKYAEYFQSQGVKYYNIGADEYANDIGSMGFNRIYYNGTYSEFVGFLNQAAAVVKEKGMTPRAFNDGIYYNNDTSYSIDKDIQVCYWSSGWGGYSLASAKTIANQGHEVINTNGDYYWILGGSQCSESKAAGFDYKNFSGQTNNRIESPAGAMFCIWCDNASVDGKDGGTKVAEKAAAAITAFGGTLPKTEKPDPEPTPEEKILTDEATGISITAPNLTALTVTKLDTVPEIEGTVQIVGWDITPQTAEGNYTGKAKVSVPVPEGWNTDSLSAYVAEADGTYTKISGTYADGQFTYEAPHFSVQLLAEVSEKAVQEEKTITLTVGEKATETQKDVDNSGSVDKTELNEQTATVEVAAKQQQALDRYELVTNGAAGIEFGEKYLIVNSNSNGIQYALTSSGERTTVTVSNGVIANAAANAEFTFEKSDIGYNMKDSNAGYLYPDATYTTSFFGGSWSYSLTSAQRNGQPVTVTGDNAVTFSRKVISGSNNTTAYLRYRNNAFSAAASSSNLYLYKKVQQEASVDTEITFEGKQVGTTYVTVGNVRYTINVVAEDLSKVTPLTVEYWITNVKVTAGNAQSKTIRATDSAVYSEKGTEIAVLLPEEGTKGSDKVVFWKTTRLAGSNKQTTAAGDDKTKAGTDFKYVRYWNGSWAYSADGVNWINVLSGDQIVAYYLQVTNVTDEIITEVVDWGVVPHTSYNSNAFVLLDYAVKYESGERTPNIFPVNGKTMAFHCDTNDKNTVHTDNNGTYRTIGMIKAEETVDYEVYMITLTPNDDDTRKTVATNANQANRYSYSGTEKVVWVDDEANLGDFADAGKHHADYSVGGEAIVPRLNIYKNQAMLVTYYIRAKQTEDALTVHYIDKTANQEFYNYNIVVNSGTIFNLGIALADPWKANLTNGSVMNSLGKTQTVSADLGTMPAIGAQYRYSDYECVEVNRSEDGKEVYLYYTFNNTHSFVVDFGLPVKIFKSDMNVDGDWTTATVAGAKYGKAEVNNNGDITYTPDKVFQGVESLQLTLTEKEDKSTQQIYLYPATTVYYEEGFASFNGFNENGSNPGKGTGTQEATKVGDNENYGYDRNEGLNKVGPSNETQAVSNVYGDNGTFTFTGTGVDIYANCTPDTGRLFIQILKDGKTVKMIQVQTALLNGNTGATGGQEVAGYNIPVASVDLGVHGTYTVKITHVKPNSEAENGDDIVNLDGFRVYGTLPMDSDVYVNDEEANPRFVELRNQVLRALNVSTQVGNSIYAKADGILNQVYDDKGTVAGAIVLSNSGSEGFDIQDLLDNGPKNELFLRNGESVTFQLSDEVQGAQIGLKAVNNATNYTVNSSREMTLNSATDMFYKLDFTKEQNKKVIITNTGDDILSITKIKAFGSFAENGSIFAPVTEQTMVAALFSLGVEEFTPETYNVTVNGGSGAGEYLYNDRVTVKADEAPAGQKFAGWKVSGSDEYISTEEAYTFFVAGDMNFTAEYVKTEEAVEQAPQAILSNVVATKRADGKYDLKFVAQLVVPEGYKINEAGLVWSNKGAAYNDEAKLDIGNFGEDSGVKVTKISSISSTYQYSVSIKGVPDSVGCVPGRAFATMVKGDGTTVQSVIELGYTK